MCTEMSTEMFPFLGTFRGTSVDISMFQQSYGPKNSLVLVILGVLGARKVVMLGGTCGQVCILYSLNPGALRCRGIRPPPNVGSSPGR